MILDRRPLRRRPPIQDHQTWPREAAIRHRCFACPDLGGGPGLRLRQSSLPAAVGESKDAQNWVVRGEDAYMFGAVLTRSEWGATFRAGVAWHLQGDGAEGKRPSPNGTEVGPVPVVPGEPARLRQDATLPLPDVHGPEPHPKNPPSRVPRMTRRVHRSAEYEFGYLAGNGGCLVFLRKMLAGYGVQAGKPCGRSRFLSVAGQGHGPTPGLLGISALPGG